MDIPLRVLIIEDSDRDVALELRALKAAGYQVTHTVAETASEMKTALFKQVFDIVISDHGMPQFDAPGALAVLQESGVDIPFIVVSGSIGEETAVALMKAGAHDYVMKDKLARLVPAIQRELKEAEARREQKQAEENLKESEIKYRLLADNVNDVICILDMNLNYTYISPSIKILSGYEQEELMKQSSVEMMTPSSRELAVKTLSEVMELEKSEHRDIYISRTLPLELRRKDGTTVWTEIKFSFIRDESQQPVGILSVIRDITERRRAEGELRKSEERLRDIMFSIADWVWEVDENGVYTYSSQKGLELLGISHEDIIGKRPFDLMPPDEAKRVAAIFSEIAANKAPIKDLENWNIGRNGERICLLTNGVPILDEKGNLKGYRGVDKEITEQKMAAEKLRRSESNLNVLIEKSVDGLIIVDSVGILCFMNPAAKILFGQEAENLIGTPIGLPLVSGETTEMEISRKDSTQRIIEMRAAPIDWETDKAFLISMRDITDRKHAEGDLRKSLLGAVQAIAAIVELKDPYTAGHQRRVSTLSMTIAQEMGVPPEQSEGIRIAGMIHDIGKVSVPSEILSKPGNISEVEFMLIKNHVLSGYDILKNIDFPWPLDQMILQHHERMDGSGYPQGLSEKKILLEAKILAVADVVEAMATHRPYRAALGIDLALEEITKNRGIWYDPEAVDICLRLFREKGFTFDA
jgi:PAS domain S-box-containing protein/putative nucleotidyltransferase with HDIG domain